MLAGRHEGDCTLTGQLCSAVLVIAGADSTRSLIQKLGR